MSKAQHTQGPWKYDGDGFDSVAAQDFGTEGYTVMTDDCTPICEVDGVVDDEEAEANARLISAAPDLLEALKELTEEAFKNMSGGKGHLIDNAYAAIAKAPGDQS